MITILRATGSVKLSSAGKSVSATVGAKVAPPLKIETGADGSIRVEQSSGTIDVGPSSTLLLPGANATKETIVQSVGRALYSVKPRKARTFAVETPYLVSVVKGTVFSVAIDEGTTSVSLLEGSVELVADGIDPVLLQPNETARRGANDRAINVTPIDTTQPTARAESSGVSSASGNVLAAPASSAIGDATFADLNEVAAIRRDVAPRAIETPTTPGSTPTVPDATPELPTPTTPDVTPTPTPTPTPPPSPSPNVPGTSPTPVPPPVLTPPDDHHHCKRKKCDSPDDHDHGPGNDRKD